MKTTEYPIAVNDGCGPYGRHLTGAVDWQKYYSICIGPSTGIIMAADTDYLVPIPPPSEGNNIDALQIIVSLGGTASFVRMAVLDAEAYPTLRLVVDGGEIASDAAAPLTRTFAATALRKNGRYFAAFCGRGAVRPSVSRVSSYYTQRSWLGGYEDDPGFTVAMLMYTRANGAFPAVYDGVYNSISQRPVLCMARLP